MKKIAIGIAAAALAIAGCSTRTQTITVETTPPGATIDFGDTQITSPGSAVLATNRDYQVLATHPGCPVGQAEIHQRMDWGSFALLMLVFPVGLPLGSMHGTMYRLEPSDLHFDLCPPAAHGAAPQPAVAAPAKPHAAPTPGGGWEQVPNKKN